MPFFLRKNVFSDSVVGIWKISEPLGYFEERVHLFPREEILVAALSPRKKLEWLASRWTLHLLTGKKDRGPCLYNKYGKPYMYGSSLEISMSHSREFVAVMISPKPIGIDIQKIVSKIYRIRGKFLSAEEQVIAGGDHEIESLHVMWGAKECLFKAYGKGQLPFISHIRVSPFFYNQKGGQLRGKVEKDAYFRRFEIAYQTIEDFMLVYAVEDSNPPAPLRDAPA